MAKMKKERMEQLLAACGNIAVEAGGRILEVAEEALDITEKGDGSPLTLADRASHDCIQQGLAKLDAGTDILSEEGDIDAFLSRGNEIFWLVDPLDGTKEFIGGLDEYTVNIALIDHGCPVLGVVYAPALGVLWAGGEGTGAYRRAGQGSAEKIAPVPKQRPETAVVSRSHLSPETVNFLEKNEIAETSPRGSSVKICAVAEGAADVYPRYGPTCIWDTGAGAAVARAAGCRVVDLKGNDLDYSPEHGVLREGFIVFPAGMQVILRGEK